MSSYLREGHQARRSRAARCAESRPPRDIVPPIPMLGNRCRDGVVARVTHLEASADGAALSGSLTRPHTCDATTTQSAPTPSRFAIAQEGRADLHAADDRIRRLTLPERTSPSATEERWPPPAPDDCLTTVAAMSHPAISLRPLPRSLPMMVALWWRGDRHRLPTTGRSGSSRPGQRFAIGLECGQGPAAIAGGYAQDDHDHRRGSGGAGGRCRAADVPSGAGQDPHRVVPDRAHAAGPARGPR